MWQINSFIFAILKESFYVIPFPCKFKFSFGGKFKLWSKSLIRLWLLEKPRLYQAWNFSKTKGFKMWLYVALEKCQNIDLESEIWEHCFRFIRKLYENFCCTMCRLNVTTKTDEKSCKIRNFFSFFYVKSSWCSTDLWIQEF